MSLPIELAEYDSRWPDQYDEERRRILDVVSDNVIAVEHIGSTAVPGLAGKPTIDIMVAVRRLRDANPCIQPLQAVGYEYVPEFEDEMPYRRFFRKGPQDSPTHHLHMVELTSAFREDQVLFRDYLRDHPDMAQRYAELKTGLAHQYGSDREAYADAKTPFVQSVLAQAQNDRRTLR